MLSLFLLAPLLTAPPQNHTEMGKLRPGVVETHTIAPGDMHLWTIDAAPGGRVHWTTSRSTAGIAITATLL